jgi:hypothetical protein
MFEHVLAYYDVVHGILLKETFYGIRGMKWQATYGEYDLDCKVGHGDTYSEAVFYLTDSELGD